MTSCYLIENPETGKLKIGIANSVKNRLEDLQTACGCKLRVLQQIDFDKRDEALAMERRLHNYFEDSRIWFEKGERTGRGQGHHVRRTEWFEPKIKDEAVKYMNVFANRKGKR